MSPLDPDISGKFLLDAPGGVFRCFHASGSEADGREKSRFFFVLNLYPASDESIVLATPTSKIQRRREARGKKGEAALVALSPVDYPELEADCVVDCNSIEPWPRDSLRQKIRDKKLQHLDPLPQAVMQRIRVGVSAARTLSPRIKRLVLGDEGGESDAPGV